MRIPHRAQRRDASGNLLNLRWDREHCLEWLHSAPVARTQRSAGSVVFLALLSIPHVFGRVCDTNDGVEKQYTDKQNRERSFQHWLCNVHLHISHIAGCAASPETHWLSSLTFMTSRHSGWTLRFQHLMNIDDIAVQQSFCHFVVVTMVTPAYWRALISRSLTSVRHFLSKSSQHGVMIQSGTMR